MNWSEDRDDTGSEDEMFGKSSSRAQERSVNVRLLSLSDEESQDRHGVELNPPRLHFRQSRKADEKKFKLALISILITGIILILIINIGLGINSKNAPAAPSKLSSCPDDEVDSFAALHCKEDFPWNEYRLPDVVIPEHYKLFLHPNLTEKFYNGTIDIVIHVTKMTNVIVLHSQEQEIKKIILYHDMVLDGNSQASSKLVPQIKEYSRCPELDFVAIHLSEQLEPQQKYTVHIEFSAMFNQSLNGFYLSHYKTSTGENQTIATTQFESVSARKAFPCFDEPSFKANFTLRMVREPHQISLSNMPIVTTNDFGVYLKEDVFKTSVQMSTYLLAYVVCDFASVSTMTESKANPVKVSVYAPKDKIINAAFALNISSRALYFYETLFGIPYPLPKLDLVAIPDFEAGAMENWGLVSYRETAILYDPKTSSTANQERVAIVITHELAHQWFGNLVTMKWWNDLWLNEGFASYMEYVTADALEPKWNFMEGFYSEHISSAMAEDQYVYTHPISGRAENSVEIEALFDSITYDKGACLINMLVSYLGKDNFFKGINQYLNKYSYGNSVNMDLIHSLAEQAKKDQLHSHVVDMIDTWTTEPGFPIISIKKDGDMVSINTVTQKIYSEVVHFMYLIPNVTQIMILVDQSRYLLSTQEQSSCKKHKKNTVWKIPLSYVTNLSPENVTWKFMAERKMKFSLPSDVKWIKFNYRRSGYFVVKYSSDLFDALINEMKTNPWVFNAVDRAGILMDASKVAVIGELNYGKLFELLTYIEKEDEYGPISAGLDILSDVEFKIRYQFQSDLINRVKALTRKLILKLYQKYDWLNTSNTNTENHLQKKLMNLVVATACWSENEACVNTALKKFKLWKERGVPVDQEHKTTVYKAGVRHGDTANWYYIWDVYAKNLTINAHEKRSLLSALCATTDEEKITFLLGEALKGDTIRSQDSASAIVRLSMTRAGSLLTWKFVMEKWDEIAKIYTVSSFSTRHIISSLSDTFTTSSDIVGAREFFKTKGIMHFDFVKRALDSAKFRVHWIETYQQEIQKWLKNYVG